MLTTFDYSQFRRDFLACKRNTHFYDPWWTDPDIWQERDYTTPVHRPTEIQALTNIAHECQVYTPREVSAHCERVKGVELHETLADMQQQRLLRRRIYERDLPLRERLAARGMTLMWLDLDTRKQKSVEVLRLT